MFDSCRIGMQTVLLPLKVAASWSHYLYCLLCCGDPIWGEQGLPCPFAPVLLGGPLAPAILAASAVLCISLPCLCLSPAAFDLPLQEKILVAPDL